MSEQPLPAMEPESRTAATGGFTLELEPEGSRQPDFPALERFRELYVSKQRRDRKQWDLWFTSPEFLAVYRDPAFTCCPAPSCGELKEEFTLWQGVPDSTGSGIPVPGDCLSGPHRI